MTCVRWDGRLSVRTDACNYQLAIDIDRKLIWLACKDTPLQIGDDTANY